MNTLIVMVLCGAVLGLLIVWRTKRRAKVIRLNTEARFNEEEGWAIFFLDFFFTPRRDVLINLRASNLNCFDESFGAFFLIKDANGKVVKAKIASAKLEKIPSGQLVKDQLKVREGEEICLRLVVTLRPPVEEDKNSYRVVLAALHFIELHGDYQRNRTRHLAMQSSPISTATLLEALPNRY